MSTYLPYPWSIYEEFQTKSDQSSLVTDFAWGIDNALSSILSAVETNQVPADPNDLRRDAERAVNTGSCKQRSRARLRRKFLGRLTAFDIEKQAILKGEIAKIRRSLSPNDWALLNAIAEGHSYQELSKTLGRSAGELRTRVSRLRAGLKQQVSNFKLKS